MATTKRRRRAPAAASGKRRRYKLDMDKAEKKAEEIESRSQSEYHELKQGWNYFFILPPWSEEGVAWKEVQRHGIHVCPKQYGRDCLLCKELRRRTKKGDTDFVDANRTKTQGYFNAIRKAEIKAKDPDAIKVLRASPTVFAEIIDYINEEKVDITDPEAAHVVGIRRKGTGMRTRYKTKVSSEPIDISRFVTDEMIEGLFDLDTIRAVQPASDKDLRKAIRGGADADDDDFDDDDDDDFSRDDLADDDDDGGDELDDDSGDDIEDELFDDDDAGDEDGEDGDDEEDGADDEDGDGDEDDDGIFDDDDEGDGDDDFDFEDEEEEEKPKKPARKKVAKKAPAKKAPAKKAPAKKEQPRRRRRA